MPVPAILASAGRVIGQVIPKGGAGAPKPGATPPGAPQANGMKPGPNGQNTPHDFGNQKPPSNTWDKINAGTGIVSAGMMIPGMMPGGGPQQGGEPGKEGHNGRPKHTPVGSDTY